MIDMKIQRLIDKLIGDWFRKDSRILVQNGQTLIDNSKFYNIKMATPNPQTRIDTVIDKTTNVTDFPVLSGNNSGDISSDPFADILSAIDTIFSMDVYARCQQVDDRGTNINEGILVSVYNPTIGCPYCVVQTTSGFLYIKSLNENSGLDVMLADGRIMTVYRGNDSDVKEWKVNVDQ